MQTFIVGEKVTLWGSYGVGIQGIATVTKAMPRKITLDNGDSYTADGLHRWGCSGSYGGTSVRKFREGDDEKARQLQIRIAINRIKFSELPIDKMEKILEILEIMKREG
jgi:hypothetical protein